MRPMRHARVVLISLLVAIPSALLVQRALLRQIRSESSPPPETRFAGGWFVVDGAEAAALNEERIGGVGFPGSPPTLIVRGELEAPADHPLATSGGVVIVTAVIGASGRVAKARVVKGSETPALRAALVRALGEFEFVPARLQGEAWPVALPLTFSVPAPSSPDAH